MRTVVAFVERNPQTCWRQFCDAGRLPLWVPGLRRAQVLAMERGLPSEIHFEFASDLVYTLAYRYDLEAKEIHWQPKLGRRDGVSGYVKFADKDAGTEITYGLEHGDGRDPAERELGDAQKLVDAFVAWMKNERTGS